MKLICTMPARNEDWCIALTARAALMACEELVVLDHASTDDTGEILRDVSDEHPGRVTILRDDDPVWNECRHRQAMLDCARSRGATHIALIDADEILTGNCVTDRHWMFRETVTRAGGNILQLPWVCLARSIHFRYCTGIWGENNVSCAFFDTPSSHWSSSGRDGYDFHHRHPMGQALSFARPMQHEAGGLMHMQFLSDRRLKAKQAAYKMQEVLRWPHRETVDLVNARYNRAVYESLPEEQPLAPIDHSWWAPYSHLMHHLRIDGEPWQERQCKDWMSEHGPERFKGLDLFGVC